MSKEKQTPGKNEPTVGQMLAAALKSTEQLVSNYNHAFRSKMQASTKPQKDSEASGPSSGKSP